MSQNQDRIAQNLDLPPLILIAITTALSSASDYVREAISIGTEEWQIIESLTRLFGGLIIGVSVGLILGGIAVLQHYTLRFLLRVNQFLPFRLIPFLNYCVDRIFLRRVGGGYIFIHRLLMEHFAAMNPIINAKRIL